MRLYDFSWFAVLEKPTEELEKLTVLDSD